MDIKNEDSDSFTTDNRYRYSRKDDLIDDGYRYSRQIDRTDSLLGAFNVQETAELPLHEPTGEKTRKTYDFTSKGSVINRQSSILSLLTKYIILVS